MWAMCVGGPDPICVFQVEDETKEIEIDPNPHTYLRTSLYVWILNGESLDEEEEDELCEGDEPVRIYVYKTQKRLYGVN